MAGGSYLVARRGASADVTRGAGLFFHAYQRDPRRQFVPIQQAPAARDAMNEYVRHTSSSLGAVPPGVGPGGWRGDTLLA
jgi:deferrochelatase/peroxidase EfeB